MNGNHYGAEYYACTYRDYVRQNPSRKLRFYRDLLRRYLSVEKPRVLDVGCAFGDFLASLPPHWSRSGIDASEYAINQAQRRSSQIAFSAATLENNPFGGPFDAVTSFDVIEHISDLKAVRNAIHDLLAPSGIFVFVVPVYDGPLGWLVHLLDPDPTHIHKNGRHFWIDWTKQAFTIRVWGGVYRYLTPFGFYAHWPTKGLRSSAPAIAVVAQKNVA